MRYIAALLFVALISFGATQIIAGPQGTVSASADAGPLNLPHDAALLAKLSADLNGRQCKVGDTIEAEARQDLKQGHDVLVKKGSTLLGHITGVHAAAADKDFTVGVIFDTVKTKDGKQFSARMAIKALAPESDMSNNDTLFDGRGMDSSAKTATVTAGHSTTLKGSHGQLTPASEGVYDIRGLNLGTQMSNGSPQYSLLVSSTGDFRLKKGTQLVLKPLEQ